MRILIAEDDITSRTILSAVLTKNGHEVVETSNGEDAWQILQRPDAPQLAILDWMMPKLDGPDVVRLVRQLETDRPPYLIILTAKGEKIDIIAGLDAGANDYLSKPFDAGELRARVAVGQRIIEMQDALIESREALSYQANHDALTGMLNRRAIIERLNQELARADRMGDQLSVGMLDIDHFKSVNDRYGHQTGDDVLIGIAQIIKDRFRIYDAAGRMGGEEFLLLAPLKPEADPTSVYDRLCKDIASEQIPTRSGLLSVTVSIGIACAATSISVDAILEAADKALYRAKESGRNRVAI